MTHSSEQHYLRILESIGEDPERSGLVDTPKRAATALEYFTKGYRESLEEVVNGALFPCEADEMVIVKEIELYSLCEHHMLPFFGHCHLAYLPNGQVLGLSKAARIVDHFARRLQLQERLTTEIAHAIESVTGAAGVGVIIEARHSCMMMRGVQKQRSSMVTSCMLGQFRDRRETRNEFLQLIQIGLGDYV